jgi:recombinational DNA repair protein RecR
MRIQNVDKIPKNILIQNILSTLNKSLATCPKCNRLEKLGICEHCNHVFCDKCKIVRFLISFCFILEKNMFINLNRTTQRKQL